jgi:SAM-dependent methyltransferase
MNNPESHLAKVPESKFGTWFQKTDIWSRYVVDVALDELDRINSKATPSNAIFLDAGCGNGSAFNKIGHMYKPRKLIAVELDTKMATQAKTRADKLPWVDVINDDILKLDVAPGSIDVILCHQTLHHVADQEMVLAHFKSILKNGGVLLLSESCISFTLSPLIKLLFRHPKHNQRTADEFTELVKAAGFHIPPQHSSTPQAWWAKPAMGLFEKLGVPHKKRAATQICIAALA